jgi:hypothetical protein
MILGGLGRTFISADSLQGRNVKCAALLERITCALNPFRLYASTSDESGNGLRSSVCDVLPDEAKQLLGPVMFMR